jgi:hypothetical protein
VRKLLFVTPAVLVLGFFGACTSTSLVGAGGECFQAIECEPGLVCIPSAGGKRICSSDLSGIVVAVPEAGAGDATPGDATITYDGAGDAPPPPKDTGVPDNNPPPQDSGGNDSAPQDSGGGG